MYYFKGKRPSDGHTKIDMERVPVYNLRGDTTSIMRVQTYAVKRVAVAHAMELRHREADKPKAEQYQWKAYKF